MTDARAEGNAALAALDRALATQPNHDGADFTEATEHLCRMRDLLIARCRTGSDERAHLGRINGIISSALTGHFPLGKIAWPLVQSGRASLAELLTTVAA